MVIKNIFKIYPDESIDFYLGFMSDGLLYTYPARNLVVKTINDCKYFNSSYTSNLYDSRCTKWYFKLICIRYNDMFGWNYYLGKKLYY